MRFGFLLVIALNPAVGFSAQVLKVKPAKGVIFIEASAKEQEKFFSDKPTKLFIHNSRTGEKSGATFLKKLDKAYILKVEVSEQFHKGDQLTLSNSRSKPEEKTHYSPLSFKGVRLNSPFFMASALLATQKPQQIGFKLGFQKHYADMELGGDHYFKKLKGHEIGVSAAVVDRELKLYTKISYETSQVQGDANLFGSSEDLMVGRSNGGLSFALPIKNVHYVGLSFKPHTVLLQGGVYEFRKHLFYWNEFNISYVKNHKPFKLGLEFTPGHSLASEDGNDLVYEEEGDKLEVFAIWPKRKDLILYGNITYWLNTQKLGSHSENSVKNSYRFFIGSRLLMKQSLHLEAAFEINSNHFYNLGRYTDEAKIAYRSIYLSLMSPLVNIGSYGASLLLKTGDESQNGNKISSNQWNLALQAALKF